MAQNKASTGVIAKQDPWVHSSTTIGISVFFSCSQKWSFQDKNSNGTSELNDDLGLFPTLVVTIYRISIKASMSQDLGYYF